MDKKDNSTESQNDNNEMAKMPTEPKIEDKPSDTHINLKVVNSEGNEVFFKIKKTTAVKKLMEAYCKRQGLINGSVRFSFDGTRLKDDATPASVGVQEGDTIDCMVEQVGGF